MPQFTRYIGIDYSGAKTSASGLTGLRVFEATRLHEPQEILPNGSAKFWSRRALAEWLRKELEHPESAVVGIDHAFSFPMAYFEKYNIERNWPAFLDDFNIYWPTDSHGVTVNAILQGEQGNYALRNGSSVWFRKTEDWTVAAKSVFLFNIPGAVASSTHAGLPWLKYLKTHCPLVHFWPFDGWDIASGRSAIVEVYPSLWTRRYPRSGRDQDQHAAYAVAAWLQQQDHADSLRHFLAPRLTQEEKDFAAIEGWILGVI